MDDNNFIEVADTVQLDSLFESAGSKLVAILFHQIGNVECRRALPIFKKIAYNHRYSYFYAIDLKSFQGESKYVTNVEQIPRIDFFHLGNLLGSLISSNEKDIEKQVKETEMSVMRENRLKYSQHNNMNMSMQQPQMNQMQYQQLQQTQQQILQNARMQNPPLYNQLMSNPAHLQQMAINQMQMTQPQTMQAAMTPQFLPPNNTATGYVPNNPPLVPNNPPLVPNNAVGLTPNNSLLTPNMQQLQQMFQIFQMMQQMGVLNTTMDPHPRKQEEPTETENEIKLPSGDKLIPLPNGKYAWIKNPNSK